MATLILADSPSKAATTRTALARENVLPLHQWLDGRWGVLFSHPNHFAPPPSTPEGFITCIAADILAEGIKPIALSHSLEALQPNWLDHAINDDAIVVVGKPDDCIVNLAEHSLASALSNLDHCFVLILDDHGRVRMTLRYREQQRLYSLGDLLDVVATLKSGARTPSRRSA